MRDALAGNHGSIHQNNHPVQNAEYNDNDTLQAPLMEKIDH